jgi:cobalt-zinc-cadmium efflux system outer membrane protein
MKRAVLSVIGMMAAVVATAVAQAAPGVADANRGPAAAPAGDTLRLADVVTAARAANLMLRAARLEADAAADRVPQAGALPDPQLQLGLMNRPAAGFGTSEPMTMNAVQLTQTVPWPGKLGFGQERARRLADARRLDADETERQLVARAQEVYYQLAYMDRALGVMHQTRELLQSFLQVSSAMYGVGTGLQQDVLRAQVAVAHMTEDITVMEQDRLAMAARLDALLGRDATAPVGALELPSGSNSLPGVDSLMGLAAQRRPALAAARERVAAAEAGYRQARRELFPDLMVGVAYGQRPQFDNLVSLMVGFSIPVWAGGRQLPMRREMAAMQASQEAETRDLYNETFARLAELRAEAERARNLSRLYTTAILPQARASVEAALSAYRVGRVDYMTLVDNQMTVNRYAIESLRLTATYLGAVSGIEALTGADLGGGR